MARDPRARRWSPRTPGSGSSGAWPTTSASPPATAAIPRCCKAFAACSSCGYAYYRTSTRTTNKKIYYYRCLGSDDYRYEHGRVCANKPVRADYLDTVVWDHITALLADPALIRNEINKRLEQARTADPATAQRQRLDAALAKATTAITRLIGAYQEQLISLDELRTRMPELRARETSLRHQIDALDSQLADREVYLKLADNLEDFLTGLRGKAATATVAERQRVLRLLVKDVLVGPEKITIRHCIPVRAQRQQRDRRQPRNRLGGRNTDDCPLRWGRSDPTLRRAGQARREPAVLGDDAGPQKRADQTQHFAVGDALGDQAHQDLMIDIVEAGGDVPFDHPLVGAAGQLVDLGDGVLSPTTGPIPVAGRVEVDLEDRFQDQLEGHLCHPIPQRGDAEHAQFPALLRYRHLPDRQCGEGAVLERGAQLLQECQHPDVLFDVAAGDRVHASCPGAPVARDPLPGHQQGGLIADQVEQIAEPLLRLGPCPSVQFALVIEYPTLRPIQGQLVDGAAIQRLFAIQAHC